MTAQQIAWAAQHDWFVRDCGDGTIMVRDLWSNSRTGQRGHDILEWHQTFVALRLWAGY